MAQEADADVTEEGQEAQPVVGGGVGQRGVDDEGGVGARLVARGLQQTGRGVDVVQPPGVGAELEGAQVALARRRDLAAHLLRRAGQRVDGAVRRNAVMHGAAEQRVHRLALRLRGEVPDRDVDRADRVHDEPAAADRVGGVVEPVPHRLGIGRVGADDDLAQRPRVAVGAGALDDGANGRRERLRLAEADEPLVRVHLHHDVVVRAVEQVAARGVARAQVDDLDPGDPQGMGGVCRATTIARPSVTAASPSARLPTTSATASRRRPAVASVLVSTSTPRTSSNARAAPCPAAGGVSSPGSSATSAARGRDAPTTLTASVPSGSEPRSRDATSCVPSTRSTAPTAPSAPMPTHTSMLTPARPGARRDGPRPGPRPR